MQSDLELTGQTKAPCVVISKEELTTLIKKTYENIVGKRENAGNKHLFTNLSLEHSLSYSPDFFGFQILEKKTKNVLETGW